MGLPIAEKDPAPEFKNTLLPVKDRLAAAVLHFFIVDHGQLPDTF